MLRQYVELRLSAGDGLSEVERIRVGASRQAATKDAAKGLRMSQLRVNELIRTAAAADLLGPVGHLSYSCVRWLRLLVFRAIPERTRTKADQWREVWVIRKAYSESAHAFVAQAVKEQWTEAQLKAGLAKLRGAAVHVKARDKIVTTPQKTYTTGAVSKMLGVAPRTVSKWCDSEKLPSFRIPGSEHRRIYEDDLRKFVVEGGMVLPEELVDVQLVSFGLEHPVGQGFRSAFELGAYCGQHHVMRAVVGDTEGLSTALEAVRFLRGRGCARIVLALSEGVHLEVAPAGVTIAHLPCDVETLL